MPVHHQGFCEDEGVLGWLAIQWPSTSSPETKSWGQAFS